MWFTFLRVDPHGFVMRYSNEWIHQTSKWERWGRAGHEDENYKAHLEGEREGEGERVCVIFNNLIVLLFNCFLIGFNGSSHLYKE